MGGAFIMPRNNNDYGAVSEYGLWDQARVDMQERLGHSNSQCCFTSIPTLILATFI